MTLFATNGFACLCSCQILKTPFVLREFMHFSKTYAQLLLTLPPELQRNAIEYRQVSKPVLACLDFYQSVLC